MSAVGLEPATEPALCAEPGCRNGASTPCVAGVAGSGEEIAEALLVVRRDAVGDLGPRRLCERLVSRQSEGGVTDGADQ
jgi:hypothetical protein